MVVQPDMIIIANCITTSKTSNFPWRNSWLNLKKKLWIMAKTSVLILVLACWGAFSSDYIPLSLFN